MKKFFLLAVLAVMTTLTLSARTSNAKPDVEFARASSTMDSIYAHYGVEGSHLLRENYPFNVDYRAGYLASQEQAQPNQYSYLWPYSGTLTAASSLMEIDKSFRKMLDKQVIPGLNEYLDANRQPAAYASYVRTAPQSDRFYDDNVWLGIDFCDIYQITGSKKYLREAEMIWKFIESGLDDVLGGGIYWCEQKKHSKNTCSNAPGTVYAMKLYAATGNKHYLEQARALYAWTREQLCDTTDNLYFDNVNLKGEIGRAKFAYNSGQMVQAAVLLYKATGEKFYLEQAQATAKACHGYFFEAFTPKDGGAPFRLIRKGNTWFTAVMTRGLFDLYAVDGNPAYVRDIKLSLDYAWKHGRDEKGLFHTDLTGTQKDSEKWLLTQAAMVEMLARVSLVELK